MSGRKADYGDHNLSFDCIAAAWEAYLTKANGHSVRVEAHDVAALMAVFKLIRSTQPPAANGAHVHTQNNVDDFVDVACYAAFAAELGSRQEYADLAKEFGFDTLPSSLA